MKSYFLKGGSENSKFREEKESSTNICYVYILAGINPGGIFWSSQKKDWFELNFQKIIWWLGHQRHIILFPHNINMES